MGATRRLSQLTSGGGVAESERGRGRNVEKERKWGKKVVGGGGTNEANDNRDQIKLGTLRRRGVSEAREKKAITSLAGSGNDERKVRKNRRRRKKRREGNDLGEKLQCGAQNKTK